MGLKELGDRRRIAASLALAEQGGVALIQRLGQLTDHQINLCGQIVFPALTLGEQCLHPLTDLVG